MLHKRPEPGSIALPVVADAARPAAPPEALGPRDIGYVKTLRISVTDHCNLRCVYCMPAEGVAWQAREHLMSADEIVGVARAALDHGIANFKLTGGEPLLRPDLPEIIRRLRALPGAGELSLTTNGTLLERASADLVAAGLDRVTVSLDSLRPERFRRITRNGDIATVRRGIAAVESGPLGWVKLNVVVMRGCNEDEVADFAAETLSCPRTVRFIEYMPLATAEARRGAHDPFVPYEEIRGAVERRFGPLEPADHDRGHGPARVWRIPGARGKVGFIHAMSAPFCATCNRLRLTADGVLRACLFDGGELDIKPLLRPAIDRGALRDAMVACVRLRPTEHGAYGNRQMSQIGG